MFSDSDKKDLWCVLGRSHSTTDLLLRFGLSSINDMLRWNWLRFHGHLIHMDDYAWPTKATMHYVDSCQPRDQPRKRLCDVICVDMRSSNQSNEDVNNRAVWSRAIKLKNLI